jgi:hypothetical protein
MIEKTTTITDGQIEMLNRIAAQREAILREENIVIGFIICGMNVDPSTVTKTSIIGNQFVIEVKE